jgi:outer membrane receptor protein involved in Fe transport
VRYSDTYSLPRLSDQWGNINNGVAGTLPNGQPVPVTPIEQAEGGLKLSLPDLQLALIGFWSQFKNLNASTYVANAAGVLTNQSLLINTTTYGVEFEGAWRPIHIFEINGSVTLQDPKLDSATTFNTVSAASLNGKILTREPKYTLTIEPAYLFEYDGMSGKLFTTIFAEGSRYQDVVNTSILPAYATVDAGIRLQVTPSLGLEFLGTNLTNSAGLTEGNARAPISNTLTAADASVGRPIFGRTFTASATYHW